MQRVDPIAFIKAKEALFNACIGGLTPAGFFTQLISQFGDKAPRAALEFDQELDAMMRAALPVAVRDEIAAQLKARFGVGHLADDPDRVVRLILRRKQIRSPDQAELVRHVLAAVDDDSVTEAQRQKLDQILTSYEQGLRDSQGSA